MSKYNLYIIHGYNGDTKETFGPYIEDKVKEIDIETYFPSFPIKQEATYESWSKVMDEYLEKGLINENTIIVAHSLGTLFIPRYLADNNIKIYTFISLAGFLEENGPREDLRMVVSRMKPTEEQIDKAISLMQNRFSIYSDNDHLHSLEEVESYAARYNSEKVFIPNVGHMGRNSGVKEIPQVIEIIRKVIN